MSDITQKVEKMKAKITTAVENISIGTQADIIENFNPFLEAFTKLRRSDY